MKKLKVNEVGLLRVTEYRSCGFRCIMVTCPLWRGWWYQGNFIQQSKQNLLSPVTLSMKTGSLKKEGK